jgi:hypothetical protein
VFSRELLAEYLVVCQVFQVPAGRSALPHMVGLYKPLSSALHRVTELRSGHQQHQLSYLAQFSADIRHIAGCENVVVDTLSRSRSRCCSEAQGQVVVEGRSVGPLHPEVALSR